MVSHFRNISQPFEHQGVYEIMFARTNIASGDEHYSKATLYADPLSRRAWLAGPTDIGAQYDFYGYNEEGIRHAVLVLKRTENGLSKREVVEDLKLEAHSANPYQIELPLSTSAA